MKFLFVDHGELPSITFEINEKPFEVLLPVVCNKFCSFN